MNAPRTAPIPPELSTLIDEVARRVLGPRDLRGAALAREVRRVSEAYRRQRGSPAELRGDRAALCARLRFFLPRDLPKIQAPLGELAAVGALPSARVLRVLDIGAGLGATSLGAALFARERPGVERVQIDAFDHDPAGLALAAELYERGAAKHGWAFELRPYALPLGSALLERARPPYHLVLLGFVLNELGDSRSDPVREQHQWLARLCELLTPDGALIALEPALRDTSRTLQAVRGLFAAAGGPPYVFAPCLQRGPCPLLERERDWCHQQLPLALPRELAALARAAGLRDAELSYSYLTLHRASRSLAELGPEAELVRVVSAPLRSKGKLELVVCGIGPTRKLRRLDRHAGEKERRREAPAQNGRHDVSLADAQRGDLLRLTGLERAEGALFELDPRSRVELVRDACAQWPRREP